ncbi:terpenoid synthase [Fomitopsis serialis]|uniref:terpenoid synthase n=1 Tax=Fomitopsis serialis TaxID=139415 RepID=UPI002008191E|nr:terpenoid synthase [Neoantrodia serialis]KAH9917069.1 terpenoid synthase [Neoantrodia serialis]
MAFATSYHLPDTMNSWPWPRSIHPDAEEVIAASAEWLRSFHAFKEESQRAFDKYDVALIAALVYPFSNKEILRIACDLFNLFFVFDLYTDAEDAEGCRKMADAVVDALHNPRRLRPDGEAVLGEITRRFWAHAIDSGAVGRTAQRRFIDYFTAYVDSVVDEAADRDQDVYRSLDSYFEIRRETVGFRPLYALMLQELPDEVAYHPAMVEMSVCATDMVIIDNDIISYNVEQSVGDVRHNLVTVTMLERKLDIDDAVALLFGQHVALQERFQKAYHGFEPHWDPATNEQLGEALRDLANLPRGAYCWHFEGGRYFGTKGTEIGVSRRVQLLPPLLNGDRRQDNIAIPVIDEMWGTTPQLAA